MELKLSGGDYVPNGRGGFTELTGREELLERVLFRLTARRGAFPLMPELGSRLYSLPSVQPSRWETMAESWAAEALSGEPVSVTAARVERGQSGTLSVAVYMDYEGETLTAALTV